MAKLDTRPQAPSPIQSAVPRTGLEPRPRLIVLFPPAELDNPDLSRRIWEIASSFHLNVLLLSLCSNFSEEAQLRRRLITTAAIIRDTIVSADIIIEHGSDWVGKLRNIWEPGDVIACLAGQKVGLWRRPLDDVLRSSLNAPLYILSEDHPVRNSGSAFPAQALSWLGSIAILGGFLWGEVKIVQLPQDWAHTALLYLCILLEIGLIWVWNSISS
jgi:hypothetical protein